MLVPLLQSQRAWGNLFDIVSQPGKLIGSSSQREELKQQQDKDFLASLAADKEKEEHAMKLRADTERKSQLQAARSARVPPEPVDGEPAVHISVRHLTLGVQKRKFKETENMSAVYDWVGSLSIHPESFTLSGCGLPKLKPSQPIITLNKLVLNMTETETTPNYPEEELNFLGYGPDSVCDDTVTDSWIAVERMTVPETLPEVIMEGDSPRWVISQYFVPEQLNFKYFRTSLKCL